MLPYPEQDQRTWSIDSWWKISLLESSSCVPNMELNHFILKKLISVLGLFTSMQNTLTSHSANSQNTRYPTTNLRCDFSTPKSILLGSRNSNGLSQSTLHRFSLNLFHDLSQADHSFELCASNIRCSCFQLALETHILNIYLLSSELSEAPSPSPP